MKKNEGFTLLETLAAIAFTMAIAAPVCSVFVSYKKGVDSAVKAAGSAFIIVKTDRLLRDKAAKICIPYWKNAEIENESIKKEFLFNLPLDKNVSIVATENLYDKKKNVRGIQVHWQIGKTMLTTKCLYSSIPVLRQL